MYIFIIFKTGDCCIYENQHVYNGYEHYGNKRASEKRVRTGSDISDYVCIMISFLHDTYLAKLNASSTNSPRFSRDIICEKGKEIKMLHIKNAFPKSGPVSKRIVDVASFQRGQDDQNVPLNYTGIGPSTAYLTRKAILLHEPSHH